MSQRLMSVIASGWPLLRVSLYCYVIGSIVNALATFPSSYQQIQAHMIRNRYEMLIVASCVSCCICGMRWNEENRVQNNKQKKLVFIIML